jgi:hypothetical protein
MSSLQVACGSGNPGAAHEDDLPVARLLFEEGRFQPILLCGTVDVSDRKLSVEASEYADKALSLVLVLMLELPALPKDPGLSIPGRYRNGLIPTLLRVHSVVCRTFFFEHEDD